MGEYTEQLNHIIYEISPEDDDYAEKLIAVVKTFRNFDEALTDFIVTKGYTESINDVDKKVNFIKDKFKKAGIIPYPRNIKKWFTEKVRIKDRSIIFQLCFAFNLNIEECEEFCQKVCLQRGFDCHYIEEAIYYYAISHQLCYAKAKSLCEMIPEVKKENVHLSSNVLFTRSIIKEIDRFKSKEELIHFLTENIDQFSYNNATAYQHIKSIWNTIDGQDGLANQERYYNSNNAFFNQNKISNWEIYLQILGFYEFDDDQSPLFFFSNRSLKPILKDNALLHPLAEESFPNRQGLEGILRGEHKSHELVRKTLILLVFYTYWVKRLLRKKDITLPATHEDSLRCFYEINHFLVDATYPPLYAGNPYDWIFLCALQDDYPLDTFRSFMKELYMHKEDSLLSSHTFEKPNL